jgi:cytidylate kinase
MEGLLIAIDGPAGSGKSSVARAIADELGFINLNTGAAYRAVALVALQEGVSLDDGASLAGVSRRVSLDAGGARVDGKPVPEDELRTPEVSAAASAVSARPEVRAVLLDVQREAARRANREGGAVVEGRDIGTVVAPDAAVKVYLTASPEERARRRAAELGTDVRTVLQDQALRDAQDMEREHSPLMAARGAVELDTSGLSVDEVVDRIVELVERARP